MSFQCKKNLNLVLLYYKIVRVRKSTHGKNKIQKNKVNELTPWQTEKITAAKQTLKIDGTGSGLCKSF